MGSIRFTKFTKPQFLKSVARPMLGRLFGMFATGLSARGITLPFESLDDADYCEALAQLTLSPETLPDTLIEALIAIEAMATPEGQERLENAVITAGLAMTFSEDSTHGDIAVQVYLAHPALLVTQHNEARLGRLSKFEYFGSSATPAPAAPHPDHVLPTHDMLARLEADLDAWFHEHNRGWGTTRVKAHLIDGELCFMVQHGDTFMRTARLKQQRLEMIHYRPAKDDVVVYSPRRDEIRVHAGTKGEKELYRRAFGRWFSGQDDYFNMHKAYTLEPLREDCAGALDPRGVPGVARIVLREAELVWGREQVEYMIRGGRDLHGSARAGGRATIPDYGTLVRAVFDFHFIAHRKPHRVEVRTPNTVKMGRGCDARVVHEWLSARGFRINACQAGQVQATVPPRPVSTRNPQSPPFTL